MIINLSAGAFEHKTGRLATWGISPYREGKDMDLNWQKAGPIGGRWFFKINGMQFSAKQITPHLKDIQQHVDKPY